MIRAATPKGVLDTIVWLVVSLLIGVLAMKVAKRMGAPMEFRLLAFTLLTGVTFAIWQVGRGLGTKAD
jgi:hypothetical protein